MVRYTLSQATMYTLFHVGIGDRPYDARYQRRQEFFIKLGQGQIDWGWLSFVEAGAVTCSPTHLRLVPCGGLLLPQHLFEVRRLP